MCPLEFASYVTINSVQYYDGSGTLQTLAPSAWTFDLTGSQVLVTAFPNTLSSTIDNPIVVNLTQRPNAQYAQYPTIQMAGLLLITHWYNNRAETSDKMLKSIPFGVDSLLRPYKDLVL